MASRLRIPLWWVQHNPLLLRGTRWLTHEGWEKLGHRLVKPTYVTNISLPTAHHIPRGPVQHHPLTHTQLSNIYTFEDMALDTDVYSSECTAQRWRTDTCSLKLRTLKLCTPTSTLYKQRLMEWVGYLKCVCLWLLNSLHHFWLWAVKCLSFGVLSL